MESLDISQIIQKRPVAIISAVSVACALSLGCYKPTYALQEKTPPEKTPKEMHLESTKVIKPESKETIDKAKSELESSVKKADELLNNSNAKKMDSADNLKDSVTHAKYAIDAQRISGSESYNIEKKSVDELTSKVNKEYEDYKAEQARIAAERAAARARAAASYSGGGYSSGGGHRNSGGAWNASYRGTDDRRYANSDGSLSEWKSGYYIAHDWSSNGQMIASKPGTVRVNGRLYRYVSSKVVSRDTTWSQVSGFVYANGGIGFQTCYGNGYLITHYEPI